VKSRDPLADLVFPIVLICAIGGATILGMWIAKGSYPDKTPERVAVGHGLVLSDGVLSDVRVDSSTSGWVSNSNPTLYWYDPDAVLADYFLVPAYGLDTPAEVPPPEDTLAESYLVGLYGMDEPATVEELDSTLWFWNAPTAYIISMPAYADPADLETEATP
jgi:hypothetical protein